jgi:hypothetical protein
MRMSISIKAKLKSLTPRDKYELRLNRAVVRKDVQTYRHTGRQTDWVAD